MGGARERLARALAELRPWHESWETLPESLREQFRVSADALLPVVQALVAEGKAEALEAAGRHLHVDPLLRSADFASYVKHKLDEQAAALRATTSGEDR